jgi:hypothetical protein
MISPISSGNRGGVMSVLVESDTSVFEKMALEGGRYMEKMEGRK